MSVTFSSDSQFAIIETDSLNSLKIIELTSGSFSTVHSISISETVQYASFLNSSNDFILIFKQTALTLIDLTTMNSYQITPAITAQAFTSDYDNNFYTCKDGVNLIEQYNVSFTRVVVATNITTNGTNSTANTTQSTTNTTTNATANSTTNNVNTTSSNVSDSVTLILTNN
jgi:hypothetical protein